MKYFFNDTADLRKYISVTEAFVFSEIENSIEISALRYLRNDMGIGKELFDEVLTGYNNGYENLSDIKKRLVHHIRSVVVKFAMSSYLSIGLVNIGKDGINQLKNENRELLKKWQKDDLHQELFKQGFENLDILLEFLEENKSFFSTWTSSQAYTITKGQFINSVAEFSQFYPLVRGRRTFLALKPLIGFIEIYQIREILGGTSFDAIKTEIAAGTISNPNKELLKLIQPAVANLVMSSALTSLNVSINDQGIQVLSQVSTTDNMIQANSVTQVMLQRMIDEANQKGTTYLNKLRKAVETGYTDQSGSRSNDADNKTYYV